MFIGNSENFAAAWMNLGIVQASLNKSDLAEESYYKALKHRHRYPDCYYNLGNLVHMSLLSYIKTKRKAKLIHVGMSLYIYTVVPLFYNPLF